MEKSKTFHADIPGEEPMQKPIKIMAYRSDPALKVVAVQPPTQEEVPEFFDEQPEFKTMQEICDKFVSQVGDLPETISRANVLDKIKQSIIHQLQRDIAALEVRAGNLRSDLKRLQG